MYFWYMLVTASWYTDCVISTASLMLTLRWWIVCLITYVVQVDLSIFNVYHSLAKARPPLTFGLISYIGSKFTSLSTHPGASLTLLIGVHTRSVEKHNVKCYAYLRIKKNFVLRFTDRWLCWSEKCMANIACVLAKVSEHVTWSICHHSYNAQSWVLTVPVSQFLPKSEFTLGGSQEHFLCTMNAF